MRRNMNKLLALALTAALCLSLLPGTALAEEHSITIGDFIISGENLEEGTAAEHKDLYLENNQVVHITTGKPITITMREGVSTTTEYRLAVSDNTAANVTVNGVNINFGDKLTGPTPFDINKGCTLNLILAAGSQNSFVGGWNEPGIYVRPDAAIVIDGTGSLTAQGRNAGAGIGGGYVTDKSAVGTITIKGGIVRATGGSLAAGIGGGAGGNNSAITISGNSVVFASGGRASIGSGQLNSGPPSDIHRNGGVIFEGDAGTTYGNVALPGDLIIPDRCTLTNRHTLTTNNYKVTNGGTIVNEGTITNDNELTNNGTITNASNGTIANTSNAVMTNNRELTNDGTITNASNGTIANTGDAVLTNNGTLTNDGTLTNNGTLINNGTIDGTGVLTGDGVFGGDGDYRIKMSLTSAAVTGLTPPAAGAAPDTDAAVAEGANYSVTSVTWSSGQTPHTGNFDYGTAYTANVTLTAKNAYAFTVAATNGSINGEAADVDGSGSIITLSYTFPVTDSAPYIPSTYPITPTAGEGGTIDPAKRVSVRSGKSQTFTITPAEGYAVADVLVDGKSVGAVTSYTFEKVRARHTIEVLFAPRWENPFTDVAEEDWFYDDVAYVHGKGLMLGTAPETFAPDSPVTRATLATTLWRLAGQPQGGEGSAFTDIPDGAWYGDAVRWAAAAGVTQGVGEGRFAPDAVVTREQMVTILHRFARYQERDVSAGESTNILSYTDAFDVAEWAIPGFQWACGTGLVEGVETDKLAPQGELTRSQLAALLHRYMEA